MKKKIRVLYEDVSGRHRNVGRKDSLIIYGTGSQDCAVGDVLDVITCAKFQNEIFRGYNFTGGRIFHFSY